jgi:hypothetical protein
MNQDTLCYGIGKIIASFQLLENEIREITWYCSEPGVTTAGRTIGEQTLASVLRQVRGVFTELFTLHRDLVCTIRPTT